MCEDNGSGFAAIPDLATGEVAVTADRRTLLKVAGAGGAGLVFSSALGAAPAAAAPFNRKRCYVLVIDGCRPDEIGGGLMPNTKRLRDSGMNFPRARSLPIMETIPNHVMMMTGMRPDKTGVPANSIYDRNAKVVRDMDRPSDLRADTIISQVNRSGRTTATVLSKDYLYGIFGTRATHRWEPAPLIPITNHAPDVFTIEAAKKMVTTHDPELMFVNLGDVDRVGHADLTGTTLQLARRAALVNTDVQVKSFIDLLKQTGRWQNTMVIVLADHSMD
ncbi:MAG TPA: alkaline phosphatase family protein, partial [Nocardioides sp.]